ncbi:MAG: LAGLIDADG family homing endonuclease [Candidatus Nanoarchaeia archaeon]
MAYDIIVGRSKKDREKFGTKGTVLIGKQYVKMGATTSMSNNIYLDVTRSHVVFVCGKRGSGKCLLGDTKITLSNGEVVCIEELEHRVQNILSVGEDLKISGRKWEGFYKRKAPAILKIKLRTGKELSLTPEHPLLTVEGWRAAQSLPVGSRIATPRTQPFFGDKALPEHEVKLLAYLLAEGHLSNRKILFTNTDETIVNEFHDALQQFDNTLITAQHWEGTYTIINRKTKAKLLRSARDVFGRFTKETRIGNRSNMRKWLEDHGMYGKLAKEREMPSAIFTLPRHLLSTFLNRLFSCDGSIYSCGSWWQVSYSSSSKSFIRDVAHLLQRFGIVSTVRKKHIKKYDAVSYELVVSGAFVSTYLHEVGFYGVKEHRATQAIMEAPSIQHNPNTDTIPKQIWEQYKPENWAAIGRKIGYAHPKALRESARYAPSRQKLLQIAVADEQEALQKLAMSDLFWDEIVAVERVEGDFTVYDICVPGTHNFVANDIVVHNSYTMGGIAEGMASLPEAISDNLAVMILDTMGVYWTMKYPNHKDEDLLEQWGMKGRGLDVMIYTPQAFYEEYKKQGIPTDKPFTLKPSELSPEDWFVTFELHPTDGVAVLIERAVLTLKDEGVDYDIDDLVKWIHEDEKSDPTIRQAAENRLTGTKAWGVFSKEGTPMKDLIKGGQVTVLDLSAYATMPGGWKIKALVLGIISMRMFVERMAERKAEEFADIQSAEHYLTEEGMKKKKMPMVWLIIDEAHEFLPREGKTAASDALITILREGRQPGVSLILATQQPGKIHTDVMTQSDVLLSHRITTQIDLKALGALMQSYLALGLDKALMNLPSLKGSALLVDDTNERMYPLRVRPRFTWHGGEAPTAMPKEKAMFTFK